MCEYVALGAHNKHTLVNVFTGDVLVANFPANFHAAFYVEIVPYEGQPEDMMFTLMAGRKTLAKLGLQFKGIEANKTALLTFPQVVVKATKEVDLKLIASCDGFKETTVLRKKIMTGVIPPA